MCTEVSVYFIVFNMYLIVNVFGLNIFLFQKMTYMYKANNEIRTKLRKATVYLVLLLNHLCI